MFVPTVISIVRYAIYGKNMGGNEITVELSCYVITICMIKFSAHSRRPKIIFFLIWYDYMVH